MTDNGMNAAPAAAGKPSDVASRAAPAPGHLRTNLTAAELERGLKEQEAAMLEEEMKRLGSTDADKPFADLDDAIDRLLPFHVFGGEYDDRDVALQERLGPHDALLCARTDVVMRGVRVQLGRLVNEHKKLRGRVEKITQPTGKKRSLPDDTYILQASITQDLRAEVESLKAQQAAFERMQQQAQAQQAQAQQAQQQQAALKKDGGAAATQGYGAGMPGARPGASQAQMTPQQMMGHPYGMMMRPGAQMTPQQQQQMMQMMQNMTPQQRAAYSQMWAQAQQALHQMQNMTPQQQQQMMQSVPPQQQQMMQQMYMARQMQLQQQMQQQQQQKR
ncbi:unnamed protein product [Pedinophyceae sp. YPF-701]|nr:unnamed protein product [Pedinophyceae sp. YPF-701]